MQLRVMIDLAESGLEEYVPLKEIADREEISRKYLENIMTVLSKAGLVDAIHGKGGGYRLNRRPEEYTLAEILNLTEARWPLFRAWKTVSAPATARRTAARNRSGRSWTISFRIIWKA